MDVDRQYSLVKALAGNADKPKQFFLSSGANGSALEHSVPEQLWSTPDNPAYGISAVKALKIANDQGIPIYTINQSNIDTILPQLQIDTDAKTDIRNAVNAGKEVTVSKTNITYNGWTGCGYIIIDPDTGSGAYMISGGMSGGWIAVLLIVTALLLLSIATAAGAVALVITSFLMPIYLSVQAWLVSHSDKNKFKKFMDCFTDAIAVHVIFDTVTLTLLSWLNTISEIIIKAVEYANTFMLGLLAAEMAECIKETFATE